jgi:hypothetical protein
MNELGRAEILTDQSAMIFRVIGPAVVSASGWVDGKVVTTAGWAEILARFARVGLKAIKMITNVKRHR